MTLSISPGHLSAVAVAVGLAIPVALHVTTWGAFKDSPFEGYHPTRQLRTLLLAAVAAVAVVAVGIAGRADAALPALGVVYTLERLATEWWKAIARSDDQTAYTIPMRLGFRGRPVDAAGPRWAVGIAVVAGLAAVCLGVHAAQGAIGAAVPGWAAALTLGGAGGWLTAVGGAWKDAPVEGFSGWKFLRSPTVATAWAVPMSLLTHSWLVVGLAAGGMAVASIETYKTFLTGDRPPGKFAGKPAQRVDPRLRRALGRAHAASWVAVGAVAAAGVVTASRTGAGAAEGAAGAVATLCGVTVVLVLGATGRLTGASTRSRRPTEPPASPRSGEDLVDLVC